MSGSGDWLQQAPLLSDQDWRHGWSNSRGPDFRPDADAPEQADRVQELVLAARLKTGAWARQVHGGKVLQVTEAGFAGEADALWTDQPGLGVIGRGADCPLILVGGTRPDETRVWGFAHASWRSTVQGITAGLILALTEAGADPAGLRAVICPSAGPCCYEVGEEVRQAALESLGPGAAWFFLENFDRLSFNLWEANIAQLTSAGVAESNIFNVGHCTICGGDLYPSYRRDGDQAGRFAAVIGF
ncbi:MAG: polyphenol oxidase family protein [Candidatus Krumholzibacteriota bacterium]